MVTMEDLQAREWKEKEKLKGLLSKARFYTMMQSLSIWAKQEFKTEQLHSGSVNFAWTAISNTVHVEIFSLFTSLLPSIPIQLHFFLLFHVPVALQKQWLNPDICSFCFLKTIVIPTSKIQTELTTSGLCLQKFLCIMFFILGLEWLPLKGKNDRNWVWQSENWFCPQERTCVGACPNQSIAQRLPSEA